MGEITHTVKTIDGYDVVVLKFKGDISVDEIINSFKYIQKNLLTDKTIGILTDTSQAELKFTISKLPKILAFLLKNKNIRKLKFAIVAISPDVVTFPMVARNKMPFLKIKVFSSRKASVKWLLE